MRTALVAFLLAAFTAAILTPLVRALARRLGALDHAHSPRKIHGQPVPRLGGIAIVLAFHAPIAGLYLLDSWAHHLLAEGARQTLALFGGALTIVALGIYDDLRGADSYKKFAVQFLVAGALWALGLRIDLLANPFGPPIHLGAAGAVVTVLWIVGLINALNLIDGLDGLAGGVALAGIGTLFVVAVIHQDALLAILMAAAGGAVLGFLFYNFNPASIFMGDTGSMFLGFVLATASIKTSHKSSTLAALLIPVIALGLPILDTLLAVARRALSGRPLFKGDREHIHHRLLSLGLSHRQAVLTLYGVCLLFAAIALALMLSNSRQTAVLLFAFGLLAVVLLRRLGYLRLQVGRLLEQRRQGRALRTAVADLAPRIRTATGAADLWDEMKVAASLLGADAVRLKLSARRDGDDTTTVEHSLGFDGRPPIACRARFELVSGRLAEGSIELGWRGTDGDIDRDTEVAVEQLAELVTAAWKRIQAGEGPAADGRILRLASGGAARPDRPPGGLDRA